VGVTLPEIEKSRFYERLEELSPRELSPESLGSLWSHLQELRRWNQTVSLVGPAAAEDILDRHYGESLAALELLGDLQPASPLRILDVGSGGGFPGLVLAACLPTSRVTLVEPRSRKVAFLQAVARKASLPCRCLNARVSRILPPGLSGLVDIVTMRALRLPQEALAALAELVAPEGRFLLWQGEPFGESPPGFSIGRALRLMESERRYLVEHVREREASSLG